MIILKTAREIELLHQAGIWTGRLLDGLEKLIQPGMAIRELDHWADTFIKENGLDEVFKGYQPAFADTPFPGHICVSINDEVVHGLPNRNRHLEDGDIVSIDAGIRYKGYVGDSARTFAVGRVDPANEHLIAVTRKALQIGIEQSVAGKHIGDIGHAIEHYVEHVEGLAVIRQYVGHGVGKAMHEDPAVPNYGKPGKGIKLLPGLVIAIEPMVVRGRSETFVDHDSWTVRTRDGSYAAHFEHTVAIGENHTMVLTGPR